MKKPEIGERFFISFFSYRKSFFRRTNHDIPCPIGSIIWNMTQAQAFSKLGVRMSVRISRPAADQRHAGRTPIQKRGGAAVIGAVVRHLEHVDLPNTVIAHQQTVV